MRSVLIVLAVLGGSLFCLAGASSLDADLVKNPKSIHGKIEVKVEESLTSDGPWLLFGVIMLAGVGIPISEEILIVPAGFLIERGELPLWPTVAAAWCGVVLADVIWMLLVRRYSYWLLGIRFFRKMFHPRRLLEVKYLLDRQGMWVVVLGRVLPGARTPVITAAGLAHMPFGTFLAGECIGATKSVAWQLCAGWLIAKGINASMHNAHLRDAVFLGVGILLLVAILWWWRRRRSHRKHRPRAPMQWLRMASTKPSERTAAL
jgi:membrane protein DedA with SNARE-associated domain